MEGNHSVDLEEAFFAKKNGRALKKLRRQAELREKRDLLREVVNIEDTALLDRMIAMGIGPEQALMLRLIPLIWVAWADGELDDREREAILKAAGNQGLASQEAAQQALGDWLEHQPDASLYDMWKTYIQNVFPSFSPGERAQMRTNLLNSTREVAEAAGGFLGIHTVSASEREVMQKIEQALA